MQVARASALQPLSDLTAACQSPSDDLVEQVGHSPCILPSRGCSGQFACGYAHAQLLSPFKLFDHHHLAPRSQAALLHKHACSSCIFWACFQHPGSARYAAPSAEPSTLEQAARAFLPHALRQPWHLLSQLFHPAHAAGSLMTRPYTLCCPHAGGQRQATCFIHLSQARLSERSKT